MKETVLSAAARIKKRILIRRKLGGTRLTALASNAIHGFPYCLIDVGNPEGDTRETKIWCMEQET